MTQLCQFCLGFLVRTLRRLRELSLGRLLPLVVSRTLDFSSLFESTEWLACSISL